MCCRPRSKTEGALPASFDQRHGADAFEDDTAYNDSIDLTENAQALVFSKDHDDLDNDDAVSLCSWTTDYSHCENLTVSSHLSGDSASECGGECEGFTDASTCDNMSPLQAPSDVGCVSPLLLPRSDPLASPGMSFTPMPMCYMPMLMQQVQVNPFIVGQSFSNRDCVHGKPLAPVFSTQTSVSDQTNANATQVGNDVGLPADDHGDSRTTLILRNIPADCSRDQLLHILESLGFRGSIDFIHVPVEFRSQRGLGYAVVNMISNAEARRGFEYLAGFDQWPTACGLPCEVGWNEPTQGVAALIERYRNSPLMHKSLPEGFRPVLLMGGVRVPFPAPTCRIVRPRIRGNKRY